MQWQSSMQHVPDLRQVSISAYVKENMRHVLCICNDKHAGKCLFRDGGGRYPSQTAVKSQCICRWLEPYVRSLSSCSIQARGVSLEYEAVIGRG